MEHKLVEHPVCNDVTKLLKKYASQRTVKFEDFLKVWKEYKFYYMHCISREPLKRSHYLELMLYTVTEAVASDSLPLEERVGALYTWYGLFLTQPQPNFVKIRLSLQDWYVLEDFHRELRVSGHHEADYIICRLKSVSAFFVCAHRQKLCLSQQAENTSRHLTLLGNQTLVSSEGDVVRKLRACHEFSKSYSELKKILADHLPPHLLSSREDLEPLLSQERLEELKNPPPQNYEEEDPLVIVEEHDEEETGRGSVLRKAYQSDPKLVPKRRKKNNKKGISKK